MSDPSSDTTGNLWKNEGNEHLSADRVKSAIDCYTMAIECDPTNHIFYSNRSAAYFKFRDYENALSDANHCIRINPEFTKAYTRKAQALLSLNCFEECYETCLISSKYESNNRVIAETMKICKKNYLLSLLRGEWFGTVAPSVGGYDQLLKFIDDENVEIGVMGNIVSAQYTINMEKEPMWMNMQLPPPPEMAMAGYTESQDMPYIFKIDCADAISKMVQKVESRVFSKSQQKKLNKSSSFSVGSSDLNLSEITLPVQASELTICLPLTDPRRPTAFKGDGVCVFHRPIEEEKSRVDICLGVRNIDEKIAALTEDDQIYLFCDEMLAILPESPLEPPHPSDSAAVQMEKTNKAMSVQRSLFEVDQKYPEKISTTVQEYTVVAIENVPERFRDKVNQLRKRMATNSQQDSEMEGTVREAMEMVQTHIGTLAAEGRPMPSQAEIQQMVAMQVMEMQMEKNPELREMADKMNSAMDNHKPGFRKNSATAQKLIEQKKSIKKNKAFASVDSKSLEDEEQENLATSNDINSQLGDANGLDFNKKLAIGVVAGTLVAAVGFLLLRRK